MLISKSGLYNFSNVSRIFWNICLNDQLVGCTYAPYSQPMLLLQAAWLGDYIALCAKPVWHCDCIDLLEVLPLRVQ